MSLDESISVTSLNGRCSESGHSNPMNDLIIYTTEDGRSQINCGRSSRYSPLRMTTDL